MAKRLFVSLFIILVLITPHFFARAFLLIGAAGPHQGMIDTKFGKNGTVVIPIQNPLIPAYEKGIAIKIDQKNKIGLAGVGGLLRYNLDGTPDASFGNNGEVTLPDSMIVNYEAISIRPNSLVFQPDGKMIMIQGPYVLRYDADGALDTSFHTEGIINFKGELGEHGGFFSIAFQPDGKFLLGGTANLTKKLKNYFQDSPKYNFALRRLVRGGGGG